MNVKSSGLNNNTLKQRNRGLILKLISTQECTSRIELAKKTGLSKVAVSHIVSEFIKDNIIEELDTKPIKGQGRNPIHLSISPKAPKMLGIYIFRDECSAVLCDIQLNVLKRSGFLLNAENAGSLFSLLYQSIDKVLESAGDERIYGMGIGALGPIDIEKGMILNPPHFYGMRDLPIVDMLKERYKIPVYFDSQYNCAALAEKYYGNGKDYQDFIFVGIANGIGSGIISNGTLYSNMSGFTSELGHMSVDWNGNQCICGNKGCLETYAGAKVIEEKLQKMTGEVLDFEGFCKRSYKKYDSISDGIFMDMMDKLACGITSSVNLLNPAAVFIGHQGYYIPDQYIRYLEEKINAQKLVSSYCYVKVLKSYFREETHIRACGCSLLLRIFEGELF